MPCMQAMHDGLGSRMGETMGEVNFLIGVFNINRTGTSVLNLAYNLAYLLPEYGRVRG